MTLPTLGEYVRHAERFGPECVYETAEELHLPELHSLARHLRRVDEKWGLTGDQRARLLDALLDRGFTHERVAELAGVADRTVRRRMVERKKPDKTRKDDVGHG